MFRLIFTIVLGVFILAFLCLAILHWATRQSVNQVFFADEYATPFVTPNGLHSGKVGGRELSWKGKVFFADSKTGINLFSTATGSTAQRYPFRTYEAQGLTDPKTPVLRLDYNQPENPFWLRHIQDEIVQIGLGGNKYLGKVHLMILGRAWTVGYFTLEKSPAK